MAMTMAAQDASGSSSGSHVKSLVGLAVDTPLHRAATLDQIETADLQSCAYTWNDHVFELVDLTGEAGDFPKTVNNHLLNRLGVLGVEILQVEDTCLGLRHGLIFKYRRHKDLRFTYTRMQCPQPNPKILSFPGAIGIACGIIWFRRPRTADDPDPV
jgi:hypothetical protein